MQIVKTTELSRRERFVGFCSFFATVSIKLMILLVLFLVVFIFLSSVLKIFQGNRNEDHLVII